MKQRGSNITSERLRLDYLHDAKLTDEQKAAVEKIVNEKIAEDLPVLRNEMAREDAEKLGAEHEFGQKYPERVSVYSIGPKGATLERPAVRQSVLHRILWRSARFAYRRDRALYNHKRRSGGRGHPAHSRDRSTFVFMC